MTDYYELRKVTIQNDPNRIATAAVLDCSLCNSTIDGMSGGGTAICVKCAKIIKNGQARGAIVYEE